MNSNHTVQALFLVALQGNGLLGSEVHPGDIHLLLLHTKINIEKHLSMVAILFFENVNGNDSTQTQLNNF